MGNVILYTFQSGVSEECIFSGNSPMPGDNEVSVLINGELGDSISAYYSKVNSTDVGYGGFSLFLNIREMVASHWGIYSRMVLRRKNTVVIFKKKRMVDRPPGVWARK